MEHSRSLEGDASAPFDSGFAALAKLFTSFSSGDYQSDINPQEVLMGLSAFFRAIATRSGDGNKDMGCRICGVNGVEIGIWQSN